MKFTKNLLQIWSDVFPETFSSKLSTSSSTNSHQQNLVEFFAFSSNNDSVAATTNGRRQRNENETANNAAATPSMVLNLEQLSSIHGRAGDDCAPDIISGIENQILATSSKKKEVSILPKHECNSSLQRKMVDSTLASILSGKNTCVVHEHFSALVPGDEENVASNCGVTNSVENVIRARETCYRALALSCLLHTIHQPPALVAVEATRKNEKFPIALIVTSSPQNSFEITSALRKIEIEDQGWSESPSSSLVKNLDDDFEILNWQQNENSSPISITNILIGSAHKVAELLQDQTNTNSNATTSSSKIFINTSKISFVWIDELDVILSSPSNHYSQPDQSKKNNSIPFVLVHLLSNLSFRNSNNNNNHHHHHKDAIDGNATPQFIFSLVAPIRADGALMHPSSPISDRAPTIQTLLHAVSHSSPCIIIQPKWVRNRNLHSINSNSAATVIDPQTSLFLWHIPNYSRSEARRELDECFEARLKPHLQQIVSPSVMAYLRLHPQQFTISEFAKYFFGFPSSSSSSLQQQQAHDHHHPSSSFLYRCRGCVLMKFASEKERDAAYRKFSGKRLGEIFSHDHDDDENKLALCYPMILPSASAICAKIVGEGFIVFESTPSSSAASFLFDKQIHIVLRNVVKSIIDVWPSPANSRVAKSIESLIARANTTTTSSATATKSSSVSNFGFYWWVTNNLQQCYSLASDGKTGKDCLENESSADGSYVLHDEVRLVVTLPSFAMACEFIDELTSSVSSQNNSNNNNNKKFSNEGFKLGKRQVVAHFVTSSASPECEGQTGESRYKLFSPNPELDPEVDADFLALETDDE